MSFEKVTLMRRDRFEPKMFRHISPSAKRIIDSAKEKDVLALTITAKSPLEVKDAKIYTREVFNEIISQ